MTDRNDEMTSTQILEEAKKKGYKLSEEELGAVAGGGEWKDNCCPYCGHQGTMYCPGTGESKCGKCGATW